MLSLAYDSFLIQEFPNLFFFFFKNFFLTISPPLRGPNSFLAMLESGQDYSVEKTLFLDYPPEFPLGFLPPPFPSEVLQDEAPFKAIALPSSLSALGSAAYDLSDYLFFMS